MAFKEEKTGFLKTIKLGNLEFFFLKNSNVWTMKTKIND